MKKVLILSFSFLFLMNLPTIVFSQTKTPTPKISATPTKSAKTTPESAEIERIQKIKELVASKVAELKLVEKKGILGVVKEKTTTQLTLIGDNEEVKIVDIDELTKFQKNGDDSFGISDVKQGQIISAIGLYNKETKRLLARFIEKVSNIPTTISGLVTEKDIKNFTVSMVSDTGKKLIDVTSSTKTYSFNKETKMVKSGFSKIEIGQRIFVVGFDDLKTDDKINASRIVHFIVLPPSEKMLKLKNSLEAQEQTKQSTESAKKLKTITR